jgi:hypothetical protein
MAAEGALDTLEKHWAVAVVSPEHRSTVLSHAMTTLSRLCAGEPGESGDPPEFLVPLASAYEFATREWLDFEGSGSPAAVLSAEQAERRRAVLETGADRAFVLTAALPFDPEDRTGLLYRTLLLAGLAEVGRKQPEFRQWLRAHRALTFGNPGNDAGVTWDQLLLRRTVELWTEVLSGSGPSGLEHAMELVASIREERPLQEPALLEAAADANDVRMRFYLFSLFHLVEAGTELLLYRLHGQPERTDRQLYARFALAREAVGNDVRLFAAMHWLFEAARAIIERRTAQLDLLPEASV